jgi:hypothetical protein
MSNRDKIDINNRHNTGHPCKWDGDVRVSGEVGVQLPKDFLAEYKAGQKEGTAHNKNQRLVNWLTFAAVVIYAGLTAFQAYETREAVKAATEANKLAVMGLRARIITKNYRFARPVALGEPLSVAVDIDNIGHSTALVGEEMRSSRWNSLPDGDMPIPDPRPEIPVENETPQIAMTYEAIPITREYIDALPDTVEGTSGTSKVTTFFYGKIIYDAIDGRHRVEFCFFLMRLAGSDKTALPLLPDTGDHRFKFGACRKWNGPQD